MVKKVAYNILLEQYVALKGLSSKELDDTFAWAVARNMSRLTRLLRPLEEEANANVDAAVKLYARKDKAGELIQVGGQPDFGKNLKKYQAKIKEIDNTLVDVEYYTVDSDKIKLDRIQPLLIVPLLDYVIIDKQ